jgi:chitinase
VTGLRISPFVALLAALSLIVTGPAQARAKPVMIGYLAAFKNMKATLDVTDLSQLTHINIAFLNPDANGVLDAGGVMTCMQDQAHVPVTAQDLRDVVTRAHAGGVKVLASLGGGQIPACSGDWSQWLSEGHRAALIQNLMQYVKDYDLDGLDVDLEWGVLTKIDSDGDYTPFVTELGQALHARHKLLTCATASRPGGMVPQASLASFDYVNIMSYDRVGPNWGTPGDEHASFADAQADIALWQAQGLPRSKLVLGIPFYGYGFNGYNQRYDYKDILTTFGDAAAEGDVEGKACAGCRYVTYNGRPTIRRKAALAAQQGAGLMIWELSADAPGINSLLDAAHESLTAAGEKADPH